MITITKDNNTNKMKKFKKIRQFKDCIQGAKLRAQYRGQDENDRPIYDKGAELPSLTFKGTVKVHGTNAGIAFDNTTKELTPQKRTASMDLIQGGHFGFVEFVRRNEEKFKEMFSLFCMENKTDNITVYGEWAGQGIQKGVGVSLLEKFFIIFNVYDHDNETYVDSNKMDWMQYPAIRCFNIYDFPTYEVCVDLRFPKLAFPLIEKLTYDVEAECPVAKILGAEGDKLVGEGIVWTCGDITFKTKGDKHAKGAKKMPTVDPIRAQHVKDFIDQTVTEARLEQCFAAIKEEHVEVTTKQIGDLMRWIFNDIMTEEGDALAHNNLERKEVSGAIANTARPWFMKKINEDF